MLSHRSSTNLIRSAPGSFCGFDATVPLRVRCLLGHQTNQKTGQAPHYLLQNAHWPKLHRPGALDICCPPFDTPKPGGFQSMVANSYATASPKTLATRLEICFPLQSRCYATLLHVSWMRDCSPPKSRWNGPGWDGVADHCGRKDESRGPRPTPQCPHNRLLRLGVRRAPVCARCCSCRAAFEGARGATIRERGPRIVGQRSLLSI